MPLREFATPFRPETSMRFGGERKEPGSGSFDGTQSSRYSKMALTSAIGRDSTTPDDCILHSVEIPSTAYDSRTELTNTSLTTVR